ncbi:peptidoglycan DD-metalloendopeptidase family protein [Streptomyces sp. NPDC005955]|uniref:M23 family metallopeptidase n=1 Tax=Streptomyces sp. NPDC005955 TaxID=3364738 RepID=UPI0036997A55
MPSRTHPTRRSAVTYLSISYRLTGLTLGALIIGSFVFDPLDEPPFPLLWPLLGVTMLLLLLVTRLVRPARNGQPAREPVEVAPPVIGRWTALNSPADKVPSHGTHGYGQTYAIDVVAEPEPDRIPDDRPADRTGDPTGPPAEGLRPAFNWLWPLVRRPDAFPAFGAPLLAVADGTVVRASDTQRDHLSRTSLPMLAYLMLVEGMARAMVGPTRVTGNYVILDLGDDTYAMYCHLRRGSLKVRPGDRVRVGQVLADCGNSGNSTEPHVHFQLMDSPELDAARGVPFRWRGVGLPANGETFTVDAAAETETAVEAKAAAE